MRLSDKHFTLLDQDLADFHDFTIVKENFDITKLIMFKIKVEPSGGAPVGTVIAGTVEGLTAAQEAKIDKWAIPVFYHCEYYLAWLSEVEEGTRLSYADALDLFTQTGRDAFTDYAPAQCVYYDDGESFFYYAITPGEKGKDEGIPYNIGCLKGEAFLFYLQWDYNIFLTAYHTGLRMVIPPNMLKVPPPIISGVTEIDEFPAHVPPAGFLDMQVWKYQNNEVWHKFQDVANSYDRENSVVKNNAYLIAEDYTFNPPENPDLGQTHTITHTLEPFDSSYSNISGTMSHTVEYCYEDMGHYPPSTFSGSWYTSSFSYSFSVPWAWDGSTVLGVGNVYNPWSYAGVYTTGSGNLEVTTRTVVGDRVNLEWTANFTYDHYIPELGKVTLTVTINGSDPESWDFGFFSTLRPVAKSYTPPSVYRFKTINGLYSIASSGNVVDDRAVSRNSITRGFTFQVRDPTLWGDTVAIDLLTREQYVEKVSEWGEDQRPMADAIDDLYDLAYSTITESDVSPVMDIYVYEVY